ncbi:TetR/AcrR family transcriptional regulator [Amycolatopsis silviterrae]|uniref:TetR/AcrR family transcriptional regulator n=1 Tax=Amycolatopsis silviterrae TaxID=1656914 RepID=A0ABW5HLM4_9PSEU
MPRSYDSPIRAARSAETRQRVVQVAGRLFAEHGYAATTLRMVARDAKVSLERVTAVGGKPALLLAAFEDAVNDGEPLGLTRRGDIAPAWAGDDLGEILAALVSYVALSNERINALTAAWSEARRADPELAAAYRRRMDDMREAGRAFVTELVARGLVDPGVDPAAIADEFWAASHPTQYDLLVTLAGWSPDRFRAWLLERTVRLIPPPDASGGATAT